MYYITREAELIGKVIAFAHMATYSGAIVLVTEDKGILVVDQKTDEDGCDDDDTKITVYNESMVRRYLTENDVIRNVLHRAEIITEEEWNQYLKDKEAERIRIKQQTDENIARREKLEYERLKKKFEGANNEQL